MTFSELALLLNQIMMSSSEVSVEDAKFLQIFEKGIKKKNDHCVVALPFWDENLVMLKNRVQALKGTFATVNVRE